MNESRIINDDTQPGRGMPWAWAGDTCC